MPGYYFGITDKGKRREHNEDAFITEEVYNKELLLACVIDGVGGYRGGDVAAEIARSVILRYLKNATGDIIANLKAAVIAANNEIQQSKKTDGTNEQMACVLTCAVTDIRNNKLYFAHIGDTRLYLLRDDSLVKISKDHSVVGFLEESGRLSEEDAMRHPKRNEINKALGFEEQLTNTDDYIDTGESPFLPGDMILLCSDGLSDMIGSNKILSILKKPAALTERAKDLVDAANEAGGNDNITAVIVENNKTVVREAPTPPAERRNGKVAPADNPGIAPLADNKNKNKALNGPLYGFLTLISVGFFVGLLFFLSQKKIAVPHKDKKDIPGKGLGDENLASLLAHAGDSSKEYFFNLPGGLKLTAPVYINKDSFVLKGNGSTISPVDPFKGPAFIIGNTCKQIILDSVYFKDFDIAIQSENNNIVCRNSRFFNCLVPVQYNMSSADTLFSGNRKDSVFTSTSTIK